MDENSKPTDSDFQNAFATEMADESAPVIPTIAPPENLVEEPVVETEEQKQAKIEADAKTAEEKATADKKIADKAEAEKTDEEKQKDIADAEAALVATEKSEETAARHAEDAAKKAATDAPTFATKEDVAAALREDREQTTSRVDNVFKARNEVIKQLHPEGIDQKIYDTNGNIIKTAQDIVDRGLTNEKTQEPYTYDEAASFMLSAGEQMAKNVEELNDWAEKVAEKNINLRESNDRVIAKYGEVFKTLPKETVQMLADTYISKQLKFGEGDGYIVEMNMTPEEYYDTVMAPYSNLTKSIEAEKTKAETDEAAKKASEQEERNGGIPKQRGNSDVKANTGNSFTDALLDELAKP